MSKKNSEELKTGEINYSPTGNVVIGVPVAKAVFTLDPSNKKE